MPIAGSETDSANNLSYIAHDSTGRTARKPVSRSAVFQSILNSMLAAPTSEDKKPISRLTLIGGPVGLALGFLIGTLLYNGNAPALEPLLSFFQPIGLLWMNALRVAVVPLIVTLLILGICSLPRTKDLGRWGSAAFVCFFALIIAGAAFTLATGLTYLAANGPAPMELPSLGQEVAERSTESGDNWSEKLIPSNIFTAVADGEILGLCVLAVLFGLALRALPEVTRVPVERVFAGIRDTVMVFIGWVIAALPIGAFALAFAFAADSGLTLAKEILHFAIFATVIMVIFGLVLMAVTWIVGRFKITRYLKSILPVQAIAVGTRSSLATMPSVVNSAQQLDLPEPAIDLVIPTSVSLFKANRVISSTAKMIFMATLFNVTLGPESVAVFVGSVAILAFASPGIPSVGTGSTFGAYMAAGIPPEGIIIFEVSNSLTDFAKTALNVTADHSVAVFVTRWIARKKDG